MYMDKCIQDTPFLSYVVTIGEKKIVCETRLACLRYNPRMAVIKLNDVMRLH